jgi:hypothetical protein
MDGFRRLAYIYNAYKVACYIPAFSAFQFHVECAREAIAKLKSAGSRHFYLAKQKKRFPKAITVKQQREPESSCQRCPFFGPWVSDSR